MQFDIKNDFIEIKITQDEFSDFLEESDLKDEYKSGGINQDMVLSLTQFYIREALSYFEENDDEIAVNYIRTSNGFAGKFFGMTDGNFILRVKSLNQHISSDVKEVDIELNTLSNIFGSDTVTGKNTSENSSEFSSCYDCFMEKKIDEMVKSFKSDVLEKSVCSYINLEQNFKEYITHTECFQKMMASVNPAKRNDAYMNVMTKLAEKLRGGVFSCCYQFDTIGSVMSVVPFVKRGFVVSKNRKYYLISDTDSQVLCEHGYSVPLIRFSPDEKLFNIADGDFVSKSAYNS